MSKSMPGPGRVTFPERIDTIMLQREPGELVADGQKIKGVALLVSSAGGKVTVTDMDG